MAGSRNIGEASDNPVGINVTAMVDIIFCLCLFFMCSFHFKQLQGKIDTWLPNVGTFPGPVGELMKDEIVVVMSWDPATRKTVHKLLHQQPAGSAEDLMPSVLQIADGYNRAGNTSYPLVIDSAPEVPWRDVVHVMDLCKGNSIERLEFAAPRRDIDK